MRRLLLYLVASLLLLTAVGCQKDIYNIFGIDTDAPISLECNGSRFDFSSTRFSSNTGNFKTYDHPEVRMHDDGGFGFDLHRTLDSGLGIQADLEFYIDYEDSPFELDKVYTLIDVEGSRACISFREQGASIPLPGGGTVTDIVTHSYHAIDGWIIFREQEPYGSSDCLFSGEFSFRGRSEQDDTIELRKGTFTDCRVCWRGGKGCNEY
jgi:hypothetical protein